jgi:hypothetical protein
MVESAAHLVDHVFPEAPVRQWVLTFPFPLQLLAGTYGLGCATPLSEVN